MISISRKAKENIGLTVSVACLLISALWPTCHASSTGDAILPNPRGGNNLPTMAFSMSVAGV